LIAVVMIIPLIIAFIIALTSAIYLGIAYSFTSIVLVDRRPGIWAAMELSRKIVTRRWWSVFGLILLNALVLLLGALPCGLGLIISGPLAVTGLMSAYDHLLAEWEQEHRS
jgi:uncharacterized membrane protein